MGYLDIQQAVVERFVAHFEELDTARCQFGNLDGIMSAILEQGHATGCYLQSDGGVEQSRQPGGNARREWVWNFNGVFMLRYRADVDMERLESLVIDRLSQVFYDDPRLGGVTPLARITDIGQPEVAAIGQDVFDFIPFNISVIDR